MGHKQKSAKTFDSCLVHRMIYPWPFGNGNFQQAMAHPLCRLKFKDGKFDIKYQYHVINSRLAHHRFLYKIVSLLIFGFDVYTFLTLVMSLNTAKVNSIAKWQDFTMK